MADTELKNKSDAELASDVRMLVSELSRHGEELQRRKIEMNLASYVDGTVRVDIYRDKRENL